MMNKIFPCEFLSAVCAMISLVISFAGGQAIQNDVFRKDTSGNPIYSQGGYGYRE